MSAQECTLFKNTSFATTYASELVDRIRGKEAKSSDPIVDRQVRKCYEPFYCALPWVDNCRLCQGFLLVVHNGCHYYCYCYNHSFWLPSSKKNCYGFGLQAFSMQFMRSHSWWNWQNFDKSLAFPPSLAWCQNAQILFSSPIAILHQ